MEKIDKSIEILQAFNEGNIIESIYYEGSIDYVVLTTSDQILLALYKNKPIRIKKEPIYRPYANTEEFLKASKEHGPYLKSGWRLYFPLWVLGEDGSIVFDIEAFKNSPKENGYSYDHILKHYTWSDGYPCSILEE